MSKYDSPVALGHPLPDVSLGDYIKRKQQNSSEIAEALRKDPSGEFCGKCGQLNDNADDVGWWYREGKYLCSNCFPWDEHTGER